MNSRKQGDVGTSFAIAYFSSNDYTVNIPLSDSQTYDLIVEKESVCQRVQVKTGFKKNENGTYWIETRTVSNTRGKKIDVKKITTNDCDLVFLMDGNGDCFVVPVAVMVGRNGVTTSTLDDYKVKLNTNFGR